MMSRAATSVAILEHAVDPVDPVDSLDPGQQRLSPEQLAASLNAMLARRDGRAPIWVFGYGSLIWKPELEFDQRIAARVHGYHRRLCLRSVTYRGTRECPGLVAGLDRGGSCAGVLYRLPGAGLREQLEKLWEREMFLGSYAPRWVTAASLDGGARVTALAFVVRRDARNYCGPLADELIVDVLRRACGRYGTSLDYLLRTVAALRELGLRDPHLERLAKKAAAAG
jgi:cation transport protein ChaC